MRVASFLSMPPDFSRGLVRVAVPIALQNLVISLVNLVDTVMVGRLGAPAIAAVGLGNQVYFLLLLLLFGIGSGSSIFTAQYWGSGDLAGIRRTTGLSLAIGQVAAAAYAVAAIAFPGQVLGLFTADPEVVALGIPYLRSVGFSYAATAASFSFSLSLRSVERVRLPLAATVVSLLINVVLNYCLIFGEFGFPELGVLGAGIATTVARWVELAIIMIPSYAKGYPPAGKLSELLDFHAPFLARYVKIAAPVVVNEMVWSLGMTFYQGIFARVSTQAAAAYNILLAVNQIAMVAFMGTANGGAVLIGKKIGEGDFDTVYDWADRFALTAPLLGLVVSAALVPTRLLLPFLFSVDPGTLAAASGMLLVLAVAFPAKIFNLHFIVGIGRAGGDTRFGMIFDLAGVWGIGVPLAALGAFVLRLEPWAVYSMAVSEELVKSLAGMWRLRSRKWLRRVA